MISACKPNQGDLLTNLLLERGGIVTEVAEHADSHRLQILYTQINRDSANRPHFVSHSFRVDESTYFYPASTVKLPAAVLALEKLNHLNIEGLDKSSVMLTDSTLEGQTAVREDSTAKNGLPSIAHYIKKILLVSDNDAYNRLYEFLGQGAFNRRLKELGLQHVRMTHRLSVFLTEEQNRHTNPVRFFSGNQGVYEQAPVYHEGDLGIPAPIPVGNGRMQNGKLIEGPMDFAVKNNFPLLAQQGFLKSVIFPNDVREMGELMLTNSDYAFLYQYMSQLPRETSWPVYNSTEYYDAYAKFFLFGDSKERIPDHIRIFNKIGLAYGFITDNAYIVDLKNKVEFFLSATLYVNENQILNDNTYEYNQTGLPFLADLGKMIYEYELARKRAFEPDLDRFILTYDR